jgi:predicted cobalt transporter CbtA
VPVTRHPADSEAVNRPAPPDEDAAVPAAPKSDPGSAASTPRLTRHRWARASLLALALLTVAIGLGAAWFLKRPGWITETVQN